MRYLQINKTGRIYISKIHDFERNQPKKLIGSDISVDPQAISRQKDL